MDTETVSEITLKLLDTIYENEDQIKRIERMIEGISWTGNSRNEFISQSTNLLENLVSQNTECYKLFLRILKERDEWLALDQFGKLQYQHMRSKLIDTPAGYGIMAGELYRWIANQDAKAKFNEYWKSLSEEGREAYLRDYYAKLAKELGLDPVRFVIGDAGKGNKGFYYDDGKIIVLSTDDFKNNSPFDLLDTIAHETRHQYQHQCVQYYEITGKSPEGMSEDLIKAWKENLDHPIDSQKDFGGYYGQQDETDARDFGSQYATDYLLSHFSGNGAG
jgi:hypothetical protein